MIMDKLSCRILKFGLVLLFCREVFGLYWNWTETGEHFGDSVPVLYKLRIPIFLQTIPICDKICHIEQRVSLMGFYRSTNGPNWLKRKNWGDENISYCDWEGILCYNRTKHVIAIKLQGNNGMRGYVGGTLGSLPYLLGVCMGGSELADDVQQLLATFKKFLLRFDFAYNKLTGTFPMAVAKDYPYLGKIQLSGNTAIGGKIPSNIYLLNDLEVLSLGETSITGEIPPKIGRLSNLTFLDFELLGMTGDLTVLKGLSNIQYIHLMSNKIRGHIPPDFGNWFPDLLELILQGNNLKGEITSSLGNLTKLIFLDLSKNTELRGQIPQSFANLVSLAILDISRTGIQGFESGLVLNSTKLSSFIASGSHLSTSIYELTKVLKKSGASLMELNVQDCDIYGKFDKVNDDTNIIDGIFSLSKLALLNLGGNNRLTGTIPDPITKISLLMYLNVSFTNLTNELPNQYMTNLKVLQQIDIRGNNYMNGDIDSLYMTADYSVAEKSSLTDNFSCPSIRYLYNNAVIKMDPKYYDRKYCRCDDGHYGLGGYCRKCMDGAYCRGNDRPLVNITNGSLASDTRDGYILTPMKPKKGYWPFPNAKNVEKLLKCPWTLPGREICNPTGKLKCNFIRSNGKMLTECGNEEHLCEKGAYDRSCSRCKKSFYKDGQFCVKCPETVRLHKQILFISLGILLIVCLCIVVALFAGNWKKSSVLLAILQTIAIFTLAALTILPSWLAELNIFLILLTIGGFGSFSKVFLKIIVFYFQVADALISTSHIWPNSIYTVKKFVTSVFNLRFSVLTCYLPKVFTPVGKLSFLMLFPITTIVFIWLTFLLWYIIKGRNGVSTKSFRYKCGNLCILFLNLAYFPLVKEVLKILIPCTNVGKYSFMPNYPWIDCGNQDHFALRSIAFTALPVYVIGIPFLFAGLLYWKRNDVGSDNEDTKQWLGSLFKNYEVEYRIYMEFLLLMRRFLIALLVAWLRSNTLYYTTLMLLVFILYLSFESHAKPFARFGSTGVKEANFITRNGLENIAEVLTLIVLCVSFTAIQLAPQSSNERTIVTLTWSIVAINAVLIMFLVGCLLKRVFARDPTYVSILTTGDSNSTSQRNESPTSMSSSSDDSQSHESSTARSDPPSQSDTPTATTHQDDSETHETSTPISSSSSQIQTPIAATNLDDPNANNKSPSTIPDVPEAVTPIAAKSEDIPGAKKHFVIVHRPKQ